MWWNLLLVLNWSCLAHQIIQLLRFSLIFVGNRGSRLAKRMILGWSVAQGRKVAGLAVSIGLTGYLLLLIRWSLWASAVQEKIPGVGRLPEWLPTRRTKAGLQKQSLYEFTRRSVIVQGCQANQSWGRNVLSRGEGTIRHNLIIREVVCQVSKLKKDMSGRDKSTWEAQRWERTAPIWKATVNSSFISG